MNKLVASMLIVAGLMAGGCGEPSSSPEDEVRAVISASEQAAEARSVSDLMALAAPGFTDRDGRTTAELAHYVRGYFIANQSVRLLTRITEIEVPAPDVAEARVTVAMVGKDAEATAAWDLAFDIVDFDIDLRRIDGEWKVIHADWRRGGASRSP